jgi:DNA-directed RNA polymerase specialized sigma24 family protein
MKCQYIKIPVTTISLDDLKTFNESRDDFVHFPDELIESAEQPLNIEYLVFHLSPSEVELLILKYLGYKASEIMPIMGISKVYSVYQIGNRLKKNAARLINLP